MEVRVRRSMQLFEKALTRPIPSIHVDAAPAQNPIHSPCQQAMQPAPPAGFPPPVHRALPYFLHSRLYGSTVGVHALRRQPTCFCQRLNLSQPCRRRRKKGSNVLDRPAASRHSAMNMHPALARTLTVLWYIAYPFWKLLQLLYFLLKPLRYTLYLLSRPFIHLAHFLIKAVHWPLQILAKLEVSFVFLSMFEFNSIIRVWPILSSRSASYLG